MGVPNAHSYIPKKYPKREYWMQGDPSCTVCSACRMMWWHDTIPRREILSRFRYCPHCGALMKDPEGSDRTYANTY